MILFTKNPRCLWPNSSYFQVEWGWEEPVTVGETMCFSVVCFQRNGQPYPVCDTDGLCVAISHGNRKVQLSSLPSGMSLELRRCQCTPMASLLPSAMETGNAAWVPQQNINFTVLSGCLLWPEAKSADEQLCICRLISFAIKIFSAS